MSSDPVVTLPPLVLYFGAVQRPEFYAGLLGSGVALGVLRDSDSIHTLEPEEFTLIERMPFADGADAVAERVREIGRRWRIEAVLNVDETLVPLWAEVCARLGLPAMSGEAAAAVRSKSEMRRRFARHIGEHASARSAVVTDEEQLLAFAAGTGYPVILKPGNLWGSYFVSRCDDRAELTAAYRRLAATLPGFSAGQRITDTPAEILVEEFLTGTNHSVECLVLEDRVWTTPVVDVVTGTDLGGTDFHHFARVTATRLSPAERTRMRDLAAEAVRALGIRRGLAHVEFVHGPTGPRLIEVAGRPGANRAPLLREAYGINLIAGYRDVLRGVAPDVEPVRDGAAAVVTPYPEHAGTLVEYAGLDRVRALPSTAQIDVYKHPGDLVRPRHEGAGSPLRIELRADSPERLLADLDQLRELSEDLFVVRTPEAVG
ncbi:ATP-grasp domain-containing protein [Streptomyces sp. CC219B]|uniref:ATP-grasp domain-containing protein n=1 Tax=Streptomyces sp. CC219B TaxID=3044574 RepID=UPI0024A8113D|nr:ATP-grasp domain-containing protein [Streptomyces sp. CC219B]